MKKQILYAAAADYTENPGKEKNREEELRNISRREKRRDNDERKS